MTARSHGEPEPVLTDPDAGVNDDPVADERVLDRCAGTDVAVPSDAGVMADHGGSHRTTVPRPILGPWADHGARFDRHAILEPGRRIDVGGRRDSVSQRRAAQACRIGVDGLHHQRHRPIRIARRDDHKALRRRRQILLGADAIPTPSSA